MHYVADLNPYLRNLFFVLVSRDPAPWRSASASRKGQRTAGLILAFVRNACDTYVRAVDFIAQRARPTLLVSYERALRSPITVGHAIADFLGVPPPADYDAWLEFYIMPDWPDASLTAPAEPHGSARQFTSTIAVRTLVEESLRVRRQGFDGSWPVNEAGVAAAGNKLYSAAVGLLNYGE